MTVPSSIDPARCLRDLLASASPDLLRSMLTTFVSTLMSAEADALCGAPYGMPDPDRINVRNGYRHRDFDTRGRHAGRRDPQAAAGDVFPGLAAGTPPPRRSGPHLRGGDLLPARGVDPADGETGGDPGHNPAVEVPGQCHGPGPGHVGRKLRAARPRWETGWRLRTVTRTASRSSICRGRAVARLLVGDHGAIRDGAHGCRGYGKGSRE